LSRRAGLTEAYVWRVQMPARQASLDVLLERFEAFARRQRIPTGLRRDVHLVLDEIVSNVVHGNVKARATCLGLELVLDQGSVTLEIIDNGKAFDPTMVQAARGSILDRPVGGLGIQLVRGLMDTVSYTRQHGSNHLVMTRRAARRKRGARV
jgi:anti-sigma regulatory factor (Ser/Thr protein kinase)